MKRSSVLEIAIMSLFVGVTISAYLVYVINYGGFIGRTLRYVSLIPVLNSFNIPGDQMLVVSFLFFILVFVIYGFIIGFMIQKGNKAIFIVVSIILILTTLIIIEQRNGIKSHYVEQDLDTVFTFVQPRKNPLPKEQYFGDEAVGDLNNDENEDVAFLVPRIDEDRTVYYVVSSIKTELGHTGTNLLFLGSNVLPKNINIESGVIVIDYTDTTKKDSVIEKMNFKIVDGKMTQIK
jgi:hypothetical protein